MLSFTFSGQLYKSLKSRNLTYSVDNPINIPLSLCLLVTTFVVSKQFGPEQARRDIRDVGPVLDSNCLTFW